MNDFYKFEQTLNRKCKSCDGPMQQDYATATKIIFICTKCGKEQSVSKHEVNKNAGGWKNEQTMDKKERDLDEFDRSIYQLRIVLKQLSQDAYHGVEDIPNLQEVKNAIDKFLANNKYWYLGQ